MKLGGLSFDEKRAPGWKLEVTPVTGRLGSGTGTFKRLCRPKCGAVYSRRKERACAKLTSLKVAVREDNENE